MADILLTRLDSRLAHGTVCTAWIPGLGADRVVIIHNLYSKDSYMKKIFSMAVPKGCSVEIITYEEAGKRWNEDKFGEGKVIVLFGDVATANQAYQSGYVYTKLQVANVSMIPGSKKVTVHKGVCIDREEGGILRKLQDEKGVEIYFQTFPQEPRRPLNDVLAKAKFKK